jgi:hypothetical protein
MTEVVAEISNEKKKHNIKLCIYELKKNKIRGEC